MAKRKQPTKREVAEENKSAWTRFFRETKMEMRKVIWPTKHEMVRYTIAVLVSVVLVSDYRSGLHIHAALQSFDSYCRMKGENICRIGKLRKKQR